jgi:phosphoglycolate phosphatase
MNRLALFDCDGTLVDSQHNICLAMEDAFVRAQMVPPTREATRRVVGLSLIEAMEALVPHGDARLHRMLAEDYKQNFQRMRGQGMVDEPLFDGIAAALEALADDGWLFGVATGKSDRGLALCLTHHGLFDRFATLQTADRHPSKPHPSMAYQAMEEAGASPDTTIMIGDTSFDMMMGAAAGMRSLGVAWGYHPATELRAAGAYDVAAHPNALAKLMRVTG